MSGINDGALRPPHFDPFCLVARGQLGLSLGNIASQVGLSLEQQWLAVSQTRRVSMIAGTETHIATLEASTISRRTTRATPGAAAGDDRDPTRKALVSRAPVGFRHR